MRLIYEKEAQVSVELILIFSSVIIIVLLLMNMYKVYLGDMNNEIESNELKNISDNIDQINDHIKKLV